MTLREEVHERIARLDDAALAKFAEWLDAFEESGFSQEFTDTLKTVRERNKSDDPDEILQEITEEVNASRTGHADSS